MNESAERVASRWNGEEASTDVKTHTGRRSYNAQLSALARRLSGIRIGTVDKFQGQEAPVVIYSMASSSVEDAPRGMPFLNAIG